MQPLQVQVSAHLHIPGLKGHKGLILGFSPNVVSHVDAGVIEVEDQQQQQQQEGCLLSGAR